MLRETWYLLSCVVIAWAPGVSPAWADGDSRSGVEEALATLAEARKTPPTTEEAVKRAVQALKTLAKHKAEGLLEITWAIATDSRQSDLLRGTALVTFCDLPEPPAERIRAFALPILEDVRASRRLRMCAAFAVGHERIANEDVRAVMERVLLRPADDHLVQRTCLREFARTAELARLKSLLLRPEVHEHPYFAVRVDVCAALASLGVRDRRALEVLCSLMTDADPADNQCLVPQEAWLSFWTLTGRAHGAKDKSLFAKVPKPHATESELRAMMFYVSWLRPGVGELQVRAVQALVCPGEEDVSEATGRGRLVRRIPDMDALREVAEESRRDIDAIVEEWRVGASK